MKLSNKQLQTLRHMLGIDRPNESAPKPYRDYYCANRGDAELIELAKIGAVILYRQSDQYDWYRTSRAGRVAAIASHREIRRPKAKRLYHQFLLIKDVDGGLTFRDFLTSPVYADVRKRA
ncbi:MAG: hypothetical protein Q4G66_07855 [bacterium]|nr:hypothetical protein [bacterium]